MSDTNTLAPRSTSREHKKHFQQKTFSPIRQFNLADADSALTFGAKAPSKSFSVLDFFAALVARANPSLGAGLMALSGGRVSILVKRLSRLRRVAGALSQGSLAPPLPIRLHVETTDVCNLSCIHCRREKMDDMNRRTIPLEVFTRMVGDIRPFYANVAGFGEPLFDSSIISKLSLLHGQGIRTSLPTNGTYIRRQRRAQLAAELPDILQLSIDGATQESFEAIRKQGDFEKIVENYRAICDLRADGRTRRGTVIRVLCALQRGNLHDYRAMYQLIGTLRGIDSFGLVPVSFGNAQASQVPSADDVSALHRELDGAIAAAPGEDEKNFYAQWRSVSAVWLKDEKGVPAKVKAEHAPCAVPWISTYIDAKGRVYPCCFLTGTSHEMGRLAKDGSGFAGIWTGARYRAFRAKLLSSRPSLEGCRNCPRNDTKTLATVRKMGRLLPRHKA